MTFPGDWILSTQRLPIHWRLDFIYTEIADTLEIGFYLHRDCRYIGRCGTRSEMTLLFSSQMQTKFRRRFRVVFS